MAQSNSGVSAAAIAASLSAQYIYDGPSAGDNLDDPEIGIEIIDVSNFSGSVQIEVDQIDGVAIKDNYPFIGYYLSAQVTTAGSGTDNNLGLRLREDDGSGTGAIRTANYASDFWQVRPQNPRTDFFQIRTGSSFDTAWGFLYNVTLEAPTVHEGHSGQLTSDGQTSGVYPGPQSAAAVEKHDAIIFRAHSAAETRTFSAGTIVLIGWKYPSAGVEVVTASMSSASTVSVQPTSSRFTWGILVANKYQRASATGRPQMRLGVDGDYEASSGDYATDWYRGVDNISNPSETATVIQAGTDDHSFTSTTVARIMNLNTAAPCTVHGRVFDDTTGDAPGTMRFMALTKVATGINDIQFGNISGGADFTAGSDTFYAVFYRNRVDVVEHDLEGLSTQNATNISEMVHFVSEDLYPDGAFPRIQHSVGGTFVTSADYHNYVVASNTVVLSTDTNVAARAHTNFAAAVNNPGFATVFGCGQTFGPKYISIFANITASVNRIRWNHAHRVAAAENADGLRWTRSAGTWAAGKSLFECRYRVKT